MVEKRNKKDDFDFEFKDVDELEDEDIETPLDEVTDESDSEEPIEEEAVEESEEDQAEKETKEESKEEETEKSEEEEKEDESEDEEEPEEEEKKQKKERKEEYKKEKKHEEKKEYKKEHKMENKQEKSEKKEFKHNFKHKHKEEKHRKHEEKNNKKEEKKKSYKIKIKKKTFYRALWAIGIIILLIAVIALVVKFKPGIGGNYGKAKLDFYIMSQCPYGTQVEDAIGPVLDKLGNSVDFSINFIASENADGTFQSLHGQNEVNEDIRQLCIIKYYPDTYMKYILCQNKDATNVETNWQSCASSNGIDTAKIKACFDGTEGKALLSESIKKSTAIKASGSPTMYLNDQLYSGGRDSTSFQRALCMKLSNHPACKDIPQCAADSDCTAEAGKIGKCESPNTKDAKCSYVDDARVNLIVLTDKRCTECDTDSVMQINNQYFPNLVTKYVDYNTTEGKQLYQKYGLTYLPAYMFDNNINKTARYAQLAQFFDKKTDSYILRADAVGSTFDPNGEICTNNIDDNGDSLIDCADPKCKETTECRPEIKKKLDLFIMSQCPYGTKALDSMKEVLSTFNGSVTFNVNYIASENADGTFQSLHGQNEVNEDMRELCAMKYYPTKYKYMDYIWCRNKDISSTEWESCATSNGMDAAKIKACAEGTEGKALLSNNIKLANSLSIGASPTWMTNNRYQFSGLDANTIKTNYCQYNAGLKGCEKTLNSTVTGSNITCG